MAADLGKSRGAGIEHCHPGTDFQVLNAVQMAVCQAARRPVEVVGERRGPARGGRDAAAVAFFAQRRAEAVEVQSWLYDRITGIGIDLD